MDFPRILKCFPSEARKNFLIQNNISKPFQKINDGVKKTKSLPQLAQKHIDRSYKKTKLHDLLTPSTDDNLSETNKISKNIPQTLEISRMKYNKMKIYNIVVAWQHDLQELFNLIYIEDYTFQDLQEYFVYSFYLMKNISSFHQILYDSIRTYLLRIRSTIYQSLNDIQDYRLFQKIKNGDNNATIQKGIYQSFTTNSSKYIGIISLITKSYQIIQEKSFEIQKIIHYFINHITMLNKEKKNGAFQHINCSDLHKTLFNEIVLKDEAIQTLLENLQMIFNRNKFYQTSFKSAMGKLSKLNLIRLQKPLKVSSISSFIVTEAIEKQQILLQNSTKLTFNTDTKSQKTTLYSHKQDTSNLRDLNLTEQTHNWSDIYISPKEQTNKQSVLIQENVTLTTNSSKKLKKKKKNQKNEIDTFHQTDEVKEFEKRLDQEFEQSKMQDKIFIEYGPQWVAKLQSKFVQALKCLHYS